MTDAHARRKEIARLLAPLSPEERQFFRAELDGVLLAARARAQQEAALAGTHPDLDAVDRQAIQTMLAWVDGVVNADTERMSAHLRDTANVTVDASMCKVITPDGALYTFVRSATDPDPLADERDDMPTTTAPRRTLLVVGSFIVVCLALLVWTTRGAPAAPRQTMDEPTLADVAETAHADDTAIPDRARSSQRAVGRDDPITLELPGPQRRVWTVVRAPAEPGRPWRVDLKADTAVWLDESVIHPILCLPPEDEAVLARMERGQALIVRLASSAERRYTVLSVDRIARYEIESMSPRQVRLSIGACGGEGPTLVVATALYEPAVDGLPPAPDQDQATLHQFVAVDVEQVTVEGGPTAERRIINVAMALTNLSGQSLAIETFDDQLVIAGDVQAARLQVRHVPLLPDERRMVVYRYDVAAASLPAQGMWQMVAPDGQRADLLVTLARDD